jgi:hypothetical protein
MKPQYTTLYRCEFSFKVPGLPAADYHVSSDKGIAYFKDGFWVDQNLKLNVASKSRYWIPPHAIRYIAKDMVLLDG